MIILNKGVFIMRNINRVLLFLLMMAGTLFLCTDKPTGPETDPAGPPPVPEGLTVTYDTLHGCAVLTWKPVAVEDLAGYVVYRNEAPSSMPEPVNEVLIEGTTFIDTVFPDIMNETNRVLTYRIKAQDNDANLSIVYSKAVTIDAPNPTTVQTFISLQLLNTRNSTASINDTVSIVATWNKEMRDIVWVEWFTGTKESLVRKIDHPPLNGEDTLRISWSDESEKIIYFAITDEGSAVWWDSVGVNVVNISPVIITITHDTLVFVGDIIQFSGSAIDIGGTVKEYSWDFNGDGTFDYSGATGETSHSYLSDGMFNAVLKVTDDDNKTTLDTVAVTVVPAMPKGKSVAAGEFHSMFLMVDGTLWSSGSNYNGQLGDGTNSNREIPVFVMDSVESMSCGTYHSMILKTDRTLWACGGNRYGQLGNGTTSNQAFPVKIMGDVKKVVCGERTTLILKTDGTLLACGDNYWGKLGIGTDVNIDKVQTTPVQVWHCEKNVRSMAAGVHHSMILRTDGTLWAAGSNLYGQLWDYSTSNGSSIPKLVKDSVADVAAGGSHSLILMADDTLWSCGFGAWGGLPSELRTNVRSMSSYGDADLILKKDGTLYSRNQQGRPLVMNDVQNMSQGRYFSLFIKTDGSIWAVGFNSDGQFGDGTRNTIKDTPVRLVRLQR